MKIHFIAIGGTIMHNLALALKKKGEEVTGSDDEIFNPSKSRLDSAGILPEKFGWFPSKIHKELDAVILGMHARKDNPELIKAQKLQLKIYSYPEYLYEKSKDKIRVVIGGSHGKTTITSMILHVLNTYSINCDYMVGAQLQGFNTMVKITDAQIIVLEGDEYLSSSIDARPKFHLYKPHIALLSGIAWDHINVFPTFELYLKQFELFIDKIESAGYLTFCSEDESLNIISSLNPEIETEPYSLPEFKINKGKTFIKPYFETISLEIFGRHNLLNMMGAKNICKKLGIDENQFFHAMHSFRGAHNRMEKIIARDDLIVYKDFAHSPSKVRATVKAICEQFLDYKIITILELHTFSSLNRSFLKEYRNSMSGSEIAYVYFNPKTLQLKNIIDFSKEIVYESFNRKDLKVFTDNQICFSNVENEISNNTVILLMSSGDFGGFPILTFFESL